MLLIGCNNYLLSKFQKSDVLGCVHGSDSTLLGDTTAQYSWANFSYGEVGNWMVLEGGSGEAAGRAGAVLTHEVSPSKTP